MRRLVQILGRYGILVGILCFALVYTSCKPELVWVTDQASLVWLAEQGFDQAIIENSTSAGGMSLEVRVVDQAGANAALSILQQSGTAYISSPWVQQWIGSADGPTFPAFGQGALPAEDLLSTLYDQIGSWQLGNPNSGIWIIHDGSAQSLGLASMVEASLAARLSVQVLGLAPGLASLASYLEGQIPEGDVLLVLAPLTSLDSLTRLDLGVWGLVSWLAPLRLSKSKLLGYIGINHAQYLRALAQWHSNGKKNEIPLPELRFIHYALEQR